jgi:hypothetical protein
MSTFFYHLFCNLINFQPVKARSAAPGGDAMASAWNGCGQVGAPKPLGFNPLNVGDDILQLSDCSQVIDWATNSPAVCRPDPVRSGTLAS